MKIMINNVEYIIEKDEFKIFDEDLIKEKLTDYFDPYDYIFGDLAYNKIRLKGFFESSNNKKKEINDIKNLDNYIENYCATGCKWFLLKKNVSKKQ